MDKELQIKMNKSKELAEMTKKYFLEELKFNTKINTGWSADSFTLYIYLNDYDYNVLTVKIEEGISDYEYLKRAVERNNKYNILSFHKATAEEIYVINLLNRYYAQNPSFNLCYVSDGYLYKDGDGGETCINFSAIAKISYDYGTEILDIQEMEGYRVLVDFRNNTMEGICPQD